MGDVNFGSPSGPSALLFVAGVVSARRVGLAARQVHVADCQTAFSQ